MKRGGSGGQISDRLYPCLLLLLLCCCSPVRTNL